jgi:soluble lytic murein transglycosylase-like protein
MPALPRLPEHKPFVVCPLEEKVEKSDLIALADATAQRYGLEPALVKALCEQESNWNPWAVRYEPAFYTKYVVPSLEVGHFGSTEGRARAISWGLMQVLGQVAREYGFGGPFLSELCDPAVGLDIGCKYFSVLMGKTSNDVDAALVRWNGGGRPSYGAEVKSRLTTYI